MKEYILKYIRQRNGYDENDKSHDSEIENFSNLQKFRDICGWRLGDEGWADQIIEYMKDCGFIIK